MGSILREEQLEEFTLLKMVEESLIAVCRKRPLIAVVSAAGEGDVVNGVGAGVDEWNNMVET
jgi:hypothetical protein